MQKQVPEKVYEKAVLKNFATDTGKHLCWSLFLIKMQAIRPFKAKDSENFKNSSFYRTPLVVSSECGSTIIYSYCLVSFKKIKNKINSVMIYYC